MSTSQPKKEKHTVTTTTLSSEQSQQETDTSLASTHLSSTYLQNILEILPCKICVLDIHSRVLLFNQAFQTFIFHMLGITITPGIVIYDALSKSPSHLQKAQILIQLALQGETSTITSTIADNDNVPISYEITYGPLIDDQHACIGIVISFNELTSTASLAKMSLPSLQTMLERRVGERTAVLEENNQALQREIVERRSVENALRQSEQNFRMLAETVPQLIWIINRDGSPNYFNRNSREFLGISEHQTVLNWQQIIHPDDWQLIANIVDQPEKLNISFRVELRMQRASDNAFRWQLVHATPIQDLTGKTLKWIASVTDIDDWKYTVKKLRQSEQNFRLLADAMPQIVWTSRPDGWLDYYNQKWFDYTGMTLEQTQGSGWMPVLHPDDVQNCIDVWAHSVQTGETYQIEYRFKRALDGIFRWHLGRALPVRDSQGQIVKWFGTCTDIHDWKIAQEQLAHLLQNEQALRAEAEATSERLEQLNKVQNDFISIVSHEFRTTLTSIQGFSEVLYSDEFSPLEVKDYATDINTDAKRLTRMINDLLDLERMKSGKMTIEFEEVDINHLLHEVVERAIPTSPHHTLLLHLDTELPLFVGDSDKIVQVLVNLLSNAIKYAPNGGKIMLTSKYQKNKVHISVQDQGIGIPPDALEEIFAPYSRIDAKRTRYIKGTGLGLAVVRQIVEMHEGQVWVESVPGSGSTFHVLLPMKSSLPKSDSPA